MQVKFDRTAPLFLLPMDAEDAFDGVVVELNSGDVEAILNIGAAVAAVHAAIGNAGAPEDSAQDLADYFIEQLHGRD